MSVLLSIAAFNQGTVRYIDFGGLLRPPLGGPDQRLNRLGNRYGLDFQVDALRSDSDRGRLLRQQLVRAKTEGVLVLFPQDGLDTGSPGNPVVNGGTQTGSTLQLRGFSAGYKIVAGQPFSVIVNGRRYVYMAAADVAVSGGAAALPITPIMRTAMPDGAICEFETPYLEGFITSDISWVYTPGRWQGQTLSIDEAA